MTLDPGCDEAFDLSDGDAMETAVPHYIVDQGRRVDDASPAEFVYVCSCGAEFASVDFTYAWSDFIDHATGMPPRDRSSLEEQEAGEVIVRVVVEPLSRLSSMPTPRLEQVSPPN